MAFTAWSRSRSEIRSDNFREVPSAIGMQATVASNAAVRARVQLVCIMSDVVAHELFDVFIRLGQKLVDVTCSKEKCEDKDNDYSDLVMSCHICYFVFFTYPFLCCYYSFTSSYKRF